MKRLSIPSVCSLVFYLIIPGAYTGFAQTGYEIGSPLIANYDPNDYNAHVQNFDIIQDSHGILYFANGIGVLQYDGASWRLISTSNKSAVRSFSKDASGRIYVGGQGDFGFLMPDSRGQMNFKSFLSLLDYPEGVTAVLGTYVTPEGVYFATSDRLYRYSPSEKSVEGNLEIAEIDSNRITVWDPETRFGAVSFQNGRLYIQLVNVGLMQMVNDVPTLVPGGQFFADKQIQGILLSPDNWKGKTNSDLIVVTATQGLYSYDGEKVKQFKTEATPFLKENIATHATFLPDGTLAIGTIRGGIVIINDLGEALRHIDRTSGLMDNRIIYTFVDIHGALWLGLDSGIARLEIPSPITLFGESAGLNSYAYGIARHQGTIYLATGFGVSYLKSSRIHTLPGIEATVWYLLSMRNRLLVATDDGLYEVSGMRVRKIVESVMGSYSAIVLHRSKKDTSRVFVGLSDGLASIRNVRSGWIEEERVSGIHEYVNSIAESEPGKLWLGTFDRLVLLDYVNGPDAATPVIQRFDEEQGLPKGGVKVFFANGTMFFAKKEGLYRYDAKNSHFYSDTLFSAISFGGSEEEYSLKEGPQGQLFINFGAETVEAIRGTDGRYEIASRMFNGIKGLPNYFMYPESDGVVWIASEKHLIRYDPRITKDYSPSYPALIRKVIAGEDSLIFGGSAAARIRHPRLAYSENSLRFEFAAISYDNPRENLFQSILEGFDDHWSAWTKENVRTYTNLPEGDYRFRILGKNIYQNVSQEAVFEFSILAPWYRTVWAYLSYGLILLGVILAIDRTQRKRLLTKERERGQLREAELRAKSAEALANSEREGKKNVELLSEIGREITSSLDIDTIFGKLYDHINQLVDASVFGVGIYHPKKQEIEYRLAIERGKKYEPYTRNTTDKNQLPVWCIENKKPVFINDLEKEYKNYIEVFQDAASKLEDGSESDEPASLIYLPLIAQDRVLGVITIQSFKKNAYTDHHLNILKNLATYTTIALDNANAYRRLNATLDNLTSTQEQLVTQQKLASLGALTAGIAHEIKNPLNFVNNFAELSTELVKELQEEVMANSDKKISDIAGEIGEILNDLNQNALKINEHGKRADSIVKSMLQHSRGNTGEKQTTDINAMLEEDINLAYHGMRAQNSEFNATIEKNLDATIGSVDVIPQDISRVFLNIITNAFYEANVKKTQQDGDFSPKIIVSSKKYGNGVEVRIRDNGNGIPDEARDKLFNPFFTTKPAGQGTGLGLSISFDIIVQEHGGEITFETKSGEFAEFIIRLPNKSR